MPDVTMLHNPSCSKSRAALELLRTNGATVHIRDYLADPPSADELRELLIKLGLRARDVVRTGEQAYAAHGLSDASTEDELVRAMAADPILVERPIVVRGGRAVVGRPPERVLDLLD